MHPYDGMAAALASRHGKEDVIAPPLAALGMSLFVARGVDTDRFGTFSGEVPRAGSMREAAIAKAQAAIAETGARLGLASEGSFGPHPVIPFLAAGREVIVLADAETGTIVSEAAVSEQTNFSHCTAQSLEACEEFLTRAGFPAHAMVVRPSRGPGGIVKGVVSHDALAEAVVSMAALSEDGLARIETDMRAHLNPTRMNEIGKLANRFAARLATLCPACGAPGFGPMRSEAGLPCAECGAPTALARSLISGCAACPHEVPGPRSDGRTHASPAECPECNP